MPKIQSEMLVNSINWDKVDNLIPAIIQDATTNKVLMLGYQNAQAITKTLESGKICFYSRTKSRLWTKGEESGNFLNYVDVALDCDQDTLIYKVNPIGSTCHKGTVSCFPDLADSSIEFITELENIVKARKLAFDKQDTCNNSYTESLFKEGIKRIAQKVGEEGVETALAATVNDNEELINEASDLIYHLIVLLHAQGLSLKDISNNLQSRQK